MRSSSPFGIPAAVRRSPAACSSQFQRSHIVIIVLISSLGEPSARICLSSANKRPRQYSCKVKTARYFRTSRTTASPGLTLYTLTAFSINPFDNILARAVETVVGAGALPPYSTRMFATPWAMSRNCKGILACHNTDKICSSAGLASTGIRSSIVPHSLRTKLRVKENHYAPFLCPRAFCLLIVLSLASSLSINAVASAKPSSS